MVMRYTCVIGIFIVGVFMTFSYELGAAVYKNAEVGQMLRRMAFLCPFMCIETVVVSILHGLGEQVSSMRYNLADCVLRVAIVYALIPIRGVDGFVIMVVASNLFTSLLNLRRLVKVTRIRLRWREWLFRPLLATLAAGQGVRALCAYFMFDQLGLWQGLAIGLCLMAAIYLFALAGIGSLEAADFGWVANRIQFMSKKPKIEPELLD
jgi:stage V sporulation protein B